VELHDPAVSGVAVDAAQACLERLFPETNGVIDELERNERMCPAVDL
jgi:hypothetical protein